MKKGIISIFVALATTIAFGQPLKPDLRLSAFGRVPADSQTLGRVSFMDEPVTLNVKLAWPDSSIVPLPALNEWWKRLHLTVSDAQGVALQVEGSNLMIVEARTKGELVRGSRQAVSNSALPDATFVLFNLPPLPPGDYTVRATMRLAFDSGESFRLRSPEERFAVRRGDEDKATRQVYLRKKAQEAHDYEDFKRIELELAQLEPENSSIYEEIARRSLNVAPPEETREFYRRSYEGFTRNVAKWKSSGTQFSAADRARIEESLARLTVFEKVYDVYVARRGDLRLESFTRGDEMTFAWVRKDGSILGVLDLKDPMIVHPLDR